MASKTSKLNLGCILPLLLAICSPSFATEILHQSLQVRLEPVSGSLQVSDDIELPATLPPEFLLHSGLAPRTPDPQVTIETVGKVEGDVPLTRYRLRLPEGIHRFTLDYAGHIVHDLTQLKESPGRSREQLAGTISTEGVHLDGASGWYPLFPNALQRFELEADLPAGWLAVSQGAGPRIAEQGERRRIGWCEEHPQDEIYLIAAPFQLYRQALDVGVEAQVFLRQPDEALARRYLDATADYLPLFQRLIGPYPYAKFALAENFWQTGYGMPSFTLLGSRVLRLPFIVTSSYPHEILHNWWGNGVYVDYDAGNWSEGLTTYLADHLLAERQGRGADYRRTALQRYTDFVRHDNDFPLRAFRGRHSTASQAVGYDKGMMLFHMLRRTLGDARFIEGLRRFYRDNRFQVAGFPQLQAAFESTGEASLDDFFRQWVDHSGAPALSLLQPQVAKTAHGYRLKGVLKQTQASAPFHLQVPIVVPLSDGSSRQVIVKMSQQSRAFEIGLEQAPLGLFVDPWFDLFRQLDAAEIPPSLGAFFGAEQVLILLPASADPALLTAYRELAAAWAGDFASAQILRDTELDRLPEDQPVLLLGWENRFSERFFAGLVGCPVSRTPQELRLWEQGFDTGRHSFALASRSSGGESRLWIAAASPASLAGLARKLPHYGNYSALVFTGDAPDNRLKRQWPVIGSPLQAFFGPLRPPLPAEPPPLVAN